MSGKVTVITGPMRSSKTLELVSRATEMNLSGRLVKAFHPDVSSRWDENAIVSRLMVDTESEDVLRISFPSTPLSTFDGFLASIPSGTRLVVFDDAQFFPVGIVEIVKQLRYYDIDVLISGLDMDCFQQPFGPMPFLLSVADEVIKKTTYCADCGDAAQISYRLVESKEQALVGSDEYISLCYDCWYDRMNEQEVDLGHYSTLILENGDELDVL